MLAFPGAGSNPLGQSGSGAPSAAGETARRLEECAAVLATSGRPRRTRAAPDGASSAPRRPSNRPVHLVDTESAIEWQLTAQSEMTATSMAPIVEKLTLAQRHLERVQHAWDEPTDWDDLALYGFYALEAAVDCAGLHFGISRARGHQGRMSLAQTLSKRGLDDVSDLLRDLNQARKSVAYGDTGLPELDAEDVASRLVAYIESISALTEQGRTQ